MTKTHTTYSRYFGKIVCTPNNIETTKLFIHERPKVEMTS